MSGDTEMFDGPAVDPEAIKRITNDEYLRHLVWLMNSGMFPESQHIFQDQLVERLGEAIREEGLPVDGEA